MDLAIAHDYLTTRGGAERVVLEMHRAWPRAPIHTSLYWPEGTFPELRHADVQPMPLNRIRPLQRNYRAALPFLAPSFSSKSIDADVVLCSSSGWAHGVKTRGMKVVYCYAPARWLYQPGRYLRDAGMAWKAGRAALAPALMRWDHRAMASADLVIAISTATAAAIGDVYGRDAPVIHPPVSLSADGPVALPHGVEGGHLLCVSRLMPYKNVDVILAAMRQHPHEHLVVVGTGPDEARLKALAPPNVRFVGTVTDAELRWLYANAKGLVAMSHEDFGLTPIEAASFGVPTAALKAGGYLDTVASGTTGILAPTLDDDDCATAIGHLLVTAWNRDAIRQHARQFLPDEFRSSLSEAIAAASSAASEVMGRNGTAPV